MIIDCPQHSSEWFKLRCGKPTASRLPDILAKRKDKQESAARSNYKVELVSERLTGHPTEHFVSLPMKNGITEEENARDLFEAQYDIPVQPIGIAIHPTMPFFAASPDGLLGNKGGLEIKCPTPKVYVEWLLEYRKYGVAPQEHYPQMYGEMACAELDWVMFVAYCGMMPANLRMFIVKIGRDNERIAQIEAEVTQFNSEVDSIVQELTAKEAVAA